MTSPPPETHHEQLRREVRQRIDVVGGTGGLARLLRSYGFDERHRQLVPLLRALEGGGSGEGLLDEVCGAWHIVEPILGGRLAIPDWGDFCSKISGIFDDLAPLADGEVARYIPQLGAADPERWGLAACSVTGQLFSQGDAGVPVCVQSCCKPINYLVALELLGEEKVHHHVGREPSGQRFNALLLNDDLKPHNPLINSGAIMVSGLLAHAMESSDPGGRFEALVSKWREASGGAFAVGFSNAVYQSERATADRNFALAYFMKEISATKPVGFPKGVEISDVLELYFQCCSIEMTCDALSVLAGTLANGGVCPLTGQRVWSERGVRSCLSLMQSCGMYDYSGQFLFEMGFPAKSGVAGLVMSVIPGTAGICSYSPRLDEYGNSVRGVALCRRLADEFHYHCLDSYHVRRASTASTKSVQAGEITTACSLAAEGNVAGLQQMAFGGFSMDSVDYDGRSPLHLAASEGKEEVVVFLLEVCGCRPDPRDRWGNTPLDDALREGHLEAQLALQQRGGGGHACI